MAFAALLFIISLLVFSLTAYAYTISHSGLRSIPGPFVAGFTNLWRLVDTWKGHHYITLMRLHRKHGNFVRIGPNVLSVSHPEAIEKIHGVKTNFPKVCQGP